MFDSQRLRIIESAFGTNAGWYVEFEGRRLAKLHTPAYCDHFWEAYRVEFLTDEPEERELLYSEDFWGSCLADYRNCEFDHVVYTAITAGQSGDRVRSCAVLVIRGLYVPAPQYPWDPILLGIRRLFNLHWRPS